jgi:hypothetical protein
MYNPFADERPHNYYNQSMQEIASMIPAFTSPGM